MEKTDDEFSWLEPLRKKTRELEEETKRIREEKMQKVKFTQITRTICPRTGIHYLDAISDEGVHYVAEMRTDTEKWICYSKLWTKDPQQPYNV